MMNPKFSEDFSFPTRTVGRNSLLAPLTQKKKTQCAMPLKYFLNNC